MKSKMWLVPTAGEVMGRSGDDDLLVAINDGIEPALDLTGFVEGVSFGEPEPL